MFFGAKKRDSGVNDVPALGAGVVGRASDEVSRQRQAWRQAAQSVTRTWSEWSAADGRSRSEVYGRYTSSLDAEELAAARLERALSDRALDANQSDA